MTSFLFAHAGEQHTTFSTGIDHWLSTSLNSFMLWLLISTIAIIAIQLISNLILANKVLIFAGLQLILGFGLYRSAPALASLIVSAGFLTVIIVTLLSLQGADNKVKGDKDGR